MIALILDDEINPLQVNDDFYRIKKSDGEIQLYFDLDINDEYVSLIKAHSRIMYDRCYYRVQEIHDQSYVGIIDRDDFKSLAYSDYAPGSATEYTLLDDVCNSIGWTVIGSARTTTISITLEDVNGLEVIQTIADEFGLMLDFDNVNKTLTFIYEEDIEYQGLFITTQFNASKVTYDADTYDLYTRVYARGSDDITFEDINDGKDYVENFTYYEGVIPYFINDDRYTDAESLLEYANTLLAEYSIPTISYVITFADLNKIDATEYELYACDIRSIVRLLDKERNAIMQYCVIEYQEYPNYPTKNVITLSTEPLTISSQMNSVISATASNATDSANMLAEAKAYVKDVLNSEGTGGYIVIDTENGEILLMNTPSKSTATKVLRMNMAGIGGSTSGYDGTYTLGMLIDGTIIADVITSGTLRAINIEGTAISGGTITGTTISTSEDMHVGENLYMGDGAYGTNKKIIFTDNTFIRYYYVNWEYLEIVSENIAYLRAGQSTDESYAYFRAMNYSDFKNAAMTAYDNENSSYISVAADSITSNRTITVTSDERLKTNIQDIDTSWIYELKIKEFIYKQDVGSDAENYPYIGIIAQDVLSLDCAKYLVEETVNTEEGEQVGEEIDLENTFYSVDYQAIAIAAVQELQILSKKVKELEERAERLEENEQ